MNERLPVPPELQHLIEKRERETDRRRGDRRKDELGPLGDIESTGEIGDVPTTDRRCSTDRRRKKRRKKRDDG